MKEKISSLGLVSLDFPGQSLASLLSSLIPDRDSFILFAPFTKENLIDYKSKIFEIYSKELSRLKKNIASIFPNVNIIDFLTEKKINYRYPEGSPRYFLHKYVGVDIVKEFPKERFLYLGPETVYHMIRALYHNIPFYERYVSVNIINQSGTLEGETKAFLLKNGLNLSDFLSNFQTKYKYFTVNSFYDKQPVYEIGTEFIFDIYRHHSIIICDRIHFEKTEKLCTDCNDCSYYCPVSANPRAILEKDKSQFNSSVCLECGICSLLCPSHIDLSTRINEIKQGANFVVA
jgi:Na+-translocating ferredoxin:NAD+ oxidoreductase RnfC subunit